MPSCCGTTRTARQAAAPPSRWRSPPAGRCSSTTRNGSATCPSARTTLTKVSDTRAAGGGDARPLRRRLRRAASWDRVAETLVRDYKAVLADGGPGRRQPVRSRLFSMTDDKPLIRRKRQLLGHPASMAEDPRLRRPALARAGGRRGARAARARAGAAARRARPAAPRPVPFGPAEELGRPAHPRRRARNGAARRARARHRELRVGRPPALATAGYTAVAGIDLDPQVRRMPEADRVEYVVGDLMDDGLARRPLRRRHGHQRDRARLRGGPAPARGRAAAHAGRACSSSPPTTGRKRSTRRTRRCSG